uniref:Putative las1-like protein n=1 Tax=Ixodes ricinus TaxID=34613 RepID=A0A131Y1B6_IXORI
MATTEFRIVPYYSRHEWERVYQNLFSRAIQDQAAALRNIAIWRSRLYARVPRAIEASAALVGAQLNDAQAHSSGRADASIEDLVRLYSSAVVRFVGDILEPIREKEQITTKEAGFKLGVPDWIVDLRNTSAHATSSHSLEVLRSACNLLLLWLRVHYWEKERERLDRQGPPSAPLPGGVAPSATVLEPEEDRVCRMLEEFRDAASGRKCSRHKMAAIKEKCRGLLADIAAEVERDCDLVIEQLLTKNFLLPDEESLEILCPGVELEPPNLDEDAPFELPATLRRAWFPVLASLGSRVQLLAERLVRVQHPPQLFLAVAWVEHLLSGTPHKGTLLHTAVEESVQRHPPRAYLNVDRLLRLALEHPHKYSAKLVPMLAKELPLGLEPEKLQQLMALVAIETMALTEDDSDNEDGGTASDDDRYTVEDFQGCSETLKDQPSQAPEEVWTLPLRNMPWESTPIGALPHGSSPSLDLDFTELRPLGGSFPAEETQRSNGDNMEAFDEDGENSEAQVQQKLLDFTSHNVQLFGV